MPLLFTNCFDLKVDGKHRLFVPTEVRKQVYQAQLGEAFFVTMGGIRSCGFIRKKPIESLLEKIPHDVDAAPEPDMLDYLHLRFCAIEPDGLGRRRQVGPAGKAAETDGY